MVLSALQDFGGWGALEEFHMDARRSGGPRVAFAWAGRARGARRAFSNYLGRGVGGFVLPGSFCRAVDQKGKGAQKVVWPWQDISQA